MLAENYTLSQPYVCENLTIFLIHGEEKLPESHVPDLAGGFGAEEIDRARNQRHQ
ncbi:MAG: hypothetical protein MOB07_26770 [Acidobacteria bacterium]|nr:hypothetical protein [Acidobacteriota bacterium]